MAQHDVSFDCSPADRVIVRAIAKRVLELIEKHGGEKRIQTNIEMDLIATHANGCPMDFKKLCAADDFNLSHDVFGIERHLDRETGELTNCFRPRCAAKQAEAA